MKYQYIDTLEKIYEVDRLLMNADDSRKYEVIALDTETNGLQIYKASVIGFSFAVDSMKGYYLPLVEWIPDISTEKTKTVNKEKYNVFTEGRFKCVWTGNTYPEFFEPKHYIFHELIPIMIERWFKGAKLLFHNAPFDVNHIFILTGVDLTDSVYLDTALLSHIINENTPNGLKETAAEWKAELGFNPHQDAAQERKELGISVILNGGDVTPSGKPKSVWRASPEFMGKYAAADAFLTFGLYEVGLQKFVAEFGEEKLAWLFEDEVMPVCKEVVIPMKRRGVYLDIPYFEKCEKQTHDKINEIEDLIIKELSPILPSFTLGKSIEEAISNQRLIKKIIDLEGLTAPVKIDKETKKETLTLAKSDVKKLYAKEPHWLWGYILGEDEIKYPESKLAKIKQELYEEVEGRRYQFNVGSDAHLRWLFCDKLGFSKSDLPQTDSATKDNPIPSVAAEVLEEHMLPKYPWVKHILTFKKLRKMQSGYIQPALNLHIDGWLYMDMKQNGTVSGRFACSGGFNLQTLPRVDDELEILNTCTCGSNNVEIIHEIETLANRKCLDCGKLEKDIPTASAIKKGFIAPPGYKIVNADYSSLEPRCFAYMSGDDKLKEVYWKDLDLYSKVYCDLFDHSNEYSADPKAPNYLKKLAPNKRKEVKPIVLGIPYGSGAFQVASMCDKYVERKDERTGIVTHVPDENYGQWIIDKYLGTYKNLHKYMDNMELSSVTKGFVESLFGRRRHFQYALVIARFLANKGIDYRDLSEIRPFQLKTAKLAIVSDNGNPINLTEDDLKTLIKELGLDYARCMAKGHWRYIRSLLKNDINNSMNFPIQSLAGSITNRGMLDATRLFKQAQVDGWVFIQVHDELSCYVREDQAEMGKDLLQVAMEHNKFTEVLDVPMIAEPTICDNLKESK
jgi:DNA polymerase I-like protein with 3'-5' exonuclease and polymerase domains